MFMDPVRLIFRFLHFLSWAVLIGGVLAQLSSTDKRVPKVALWGARLAFVTGLLLVGVKEMIAAQGGPEVNHVKVGAKLLIAIVPVAMLEIGNRRGLKDGAFWRVLGSSTLAMEIAVFWV
jgi:hypothetical protein